MKKIETPNFIKLSLGRRPRAMQPQAIGFAFADQSLPPRALPSRASRRGIAAGAPIDAARLDITHPLM